MKRKFPILLATLLVAGAGLFYAVNNGYILSSRPAQSNFDAAISQSTKPDSQKAAENSGELPSQEDWKKEAEKVPAKVSSQAPEAQTLAVPTAAPTSASEPVVATSIAFHKSTDLTLNVGSINRRSATTTPEGQPVIYTSSNPGVAVVSTDGTVTSLSVGETVISAKSGNAIASYNLMIADAPLEAQSVSSPKAENAGTVFEGYAVTVTDTKTPAARSGGMDWPITIYYFIAEDGSKPGSISGKAYVSIMEKYRVKSSTGEWVPPDSSEDWVKWFADAFNEYRGIQANSSAGTNGRTDGAVHTFSKIDTNFDASLFASEAFDLINQERVNAGLDEVEMDSEMAELAQMRAEELEEKYDHVRPNGTRMSTEYKFAEINNRRANTASIAVSSWMGSSGHRDIILKDKYNYAGIGCYKGEDGTVYWCMLFSK